MNKIRWGIAGPGNIANKFAKAIKNVEDAELAAVASRSIDKAKEFADKYDIEISFGSYEEMALSDKIDAVYISTIHPFHKACAELFLNNGKHVLCEKPICINQSQAKSLFECAKKNGKFLMEAMWTRFLPAIRETKAIIERGEIGKVMAIEADFCYRETPESCAILFDNAIAGGALLDVGIYPLNLAAYLLESIPEKIAATSYNENGVDIHTQMTLSYPEGVMASLSCAIGVQKPETAFIYGTEGYIKLPSFYGAQEIIICKDGEEKVIEKPSIGDGFEEEIIEACQCIQNGRTQSSVMPHSESLAILSEMDEIRKQIGITYPLEGEK
jgi:predicted dehydrogenase